MAKPETTFTAAVHRHLPPGRENPYWIKNNNLYTAGQFDIWYSGRARDLWVEYKFVALPKRADTLIDPGLSEMQKDWGRKRYNEGRNLAVIVGCVEGGVIFRGPDAWEKPLSREEFMGLLVTRRDITNWLIKETCSP